MRYLLKNIHRQNNKQSGQTLIETIAAIFILTTALTAGLGMSLYALNGAAKDKNQIIATNLAREGIDVARMLRDTNWLDGGAQDPAGSNSKRLQGCTINSLTQPCFPEAFTAPNNFNLTNGALTNDQWRYRFTPSTRSWYKDDAQGSAKRFIICLITDPSSQYYGTYQNDDPGGSGIVCNSSNWARRILITVRTGTTFNYSSTDLDNAEVIVQSVVQWGGKNCPALTSTTILTATPASCKVIAEERLTNWKDYR